MRGIPSNFSSDQESLCAAVEGVLRCEMVQGRRDFGYVCWDDAGREDWIIPSVTAHSAASLFIHSEYGDGTRHVLPGRFSALFIPPQVSWVCLGVLMNP